jgi:hypothetical protein
MQTCKGCIWEVFELEITVYLCVVLLMKQVAYFLCAASIMRYCFVIRRIVHV